ncbi:MAG: hypothetical protein NCW75_13740 [Phycisphaera sp.]|nr:MAG: hypothetical protein NCW75_13740 [Phycisphaera sp.]
MSSTVALVGLVTSPQCAFAQCGDEELSQSTDPDVIQASRAAWCGTLDFNEQTQIGRGFTAPYDLTISCVTFGVTRNTGADWPCQVRILGGAITDPYASRPVLAEATVVVPAGTTSEFFTAALPAAFVPEGQAFIVELDTPSRNPATGGDGELLSLGFNALGQSSPTYLRSEACGLPEFTDVSGLGFPNSHAAISVGVTAGYAVPVLGGFPISPIGPVALGTVGGEVAAYGDGSAAPFGLSVAYGDLTMGVDASFRALSTDDQIDPTVTIAFKSDPGAAGDRIVFRNNPATSDEAVLELDFDSAGFDRFNVHVFREGELVGTLEDQTSGSVRFMNPDEAFWNWVKGLFGIGVEAGCQRDIEYFESGAVKRDRSFYGVRTPPAVVAPTTGGGPTLLGDEIWIEPFEPSISVSPPVMVEFTATGIVGIAIDVSASAPGVVIGEAETSLRPFGTGTVTQVGVSMRAIDETGAHSLTATDVTGDGLADLRYRKRAPRDRDDGRLRMELGGVVSASVGIDVLAPDPAAACMTVCSFEVGSFIIPSGKMSLDPWPIDPDLVAVAPDFTGVGDETYTLQIFDLSGTLVHEESGLQGIAGGCSSWPSEIGKLGGTTPCFKTCYPPDSVFRTAGGLEFDVHELRALAEGAPDAGPLASLDFSILNMDELVLFDPVTELPAIAKPCRADIDGDGALTIFDFLAFQNLFSAGDPAADFDDDGQLTIFDFLLFQNEFSAGCP